MSQSVKVKARPGHTLLFPEICVHCAQPASERMPIRKRRGQIIRLIDVPICSSCSRELQLKSGEEERWQRLGLIATVGIGIFLFVTGVLVLPGMLPLWLRLITAFIMAILAAAGVRILFTHKSLAMARPQKKAILKSDLGLTPMNDGKLIRLSIPRLTEERRRELVRVVARRVEEARIAIRNLRRDALKDLQDFEKEKMISEDDFFRGKDEVQDLTDEFIETIDGIGKRKEEEVMEI